jgi:hypothetical protein
MKCLMTIAWLGFAICLLLGTVLAYAEEEPVFAGADQYLSMSAGIFDWTGIKEAVAGAVGSFVETVENLIPAGIISPVADPPSEPTQFQIAWANPDNAQYEGELELIGLPENLPQLSLQEQRDFALNWEYRYGPDSISTPPFENTYTQKVRMGPPLEGGPDLYNGSQWGANFWQFEYDAQGKLDAVKISVQSYRYSLETGDQFSEIAEIVTRRTPAEIKIWAHH